MFTKEDKKFLEERFGSLEGRMGGLEGRMGGLEGRMAKLETEVRHNGVLIEKVQSDIGLLVESNQAFHSRVSRLEMAVFE